MTTDRPSIIEGDDLQWRGPLASLLRPMSAAYFRRVALITGVLFGLGGLIAAMFALGLFDVPGSHRRWFAPISVAALSSTVLLKPMLDRVSDERLPVVAPATIFVLIWVALGLITATVTQAGPRLGVTAVYFVETPLLCFVYVRRAWAIVVAFATMASYAFALSRVPGTVAPLAQWLIVVTSAIAISYLIGTLATRVDDSRRAETQAKGELASLNARLRRFLAPQVVAVIDEDQALAPHRREIAAFFVDLRGFTAFTNGADPARVVAILGEYYAAVGLIVDKYGGTIGGFDGDGVFAFLGDPVPNENAARDAVDMARAVASELDRLIPAWSPELGYGIGVAFGEATVGLVGFEGRLDYSPIGACVNLAARLCADAKHGEIVIDESLKALADGPRGNVDLKGFGVVETYGIAH